MTGAPEPQSESPWYRRLFDGFYYDVWFKRGASGEAEAARTLSEVDFLLSVLTLPPGSAVLDLACGHGRHAIELAKRGYQVTGLDLSASHLALAREAAAASGVTVNWVEADMRDLPPGPFDAVINLFSAFGYLESDAADQQVLTAVGQVLRPGGRFILETRNREQVVRTFQPRVWQPLADGSLFLQEATLDLIEGRIHTRVTLVEPDGRREQRDFIVRQYTLAELVHMLGAAGLTMHESWGGIDGSRYTLDSPRLLVLAERSTTAEHQPV
jgi:SAM-dependent methyltransferase